METKEKTYSDRLKAALNKISFIHIYIDSPDTQMAVLEGLQEIVSVQEDLVEDERSWKE